MGAAANPIYARLTRHAHWPSLRAALWIGLGVGIVTLAVAGWAGSYADDQPLSPGPPRSRYGVRGLPPLGDFGVLLRLAGKHPLTAATLAFTLVGLLAAVSAPLWAGSAGALQVGRDLRDGQSHQLLFLTHLSRRAIVNGYLRAVCHRLRLPPAIPLGLVYCRMVLMRQLMQSARLLPCPPGMLSFICVPLAATQMLPIGLIFALVILGLWGMTLLAAVMGVGLALWRWPVLAVVGGVALVAGSYSLALAILFRHVFRLVSWYPADGWPIGLLAAIPYLAAAGMWFVAPRRMMA